MRNRILYAVILLLACSPLFILDADPAARDGLALRRALTEAIDTLDVSGPVLLKALPGVPLYHPEHTDALRAVTHAVTVEQTSEGLFATPEQTTTQPALLLFMGKTELGEVEIFQEDGSQILNKEGLPARGRVGNQWALLPPLLAILLAFLTRNTLGSLFLGVLLGGFMLVPKGAPSSKPSTFFSWKSFGGTFCSIPSTFGFLALCSSFRRRLPWSPAWEALRAW